MYFVFDIVQYVSMFGQIMEISLYAHTYVRAYIIRIYHNKKWELLIYVCKYKVMLRHCPRFFFLRRLHAWASASWTMDYFFSNSSGQFQNCGNCPKILLFMRANSTCTSSVLCHQPALCDNLTQSPPIMHFVCSAEYFVKTVIFASFIVHFEWWKLICNCYSP